MMIAQGCKWWDHEVYLLTSLRYFSVVLACANFCSELLSLPTGLKLVDN
jgi:hypothetical protein